MPVNDKDNKERLRIPVSMLKVGMFVEDVFSEKGVLLLSEGKAISSNQQIEKLMSRGVSQVVVNREKSSVKPVLPSDSASSANIVDRSSREVAYYTELPKAKEVHETTFECARKILSSIRNRNEFSVRSVNDAAISIAESVTRNPDALVSLTQIKGYDEYTYVHSVNVGILMTALAQEFGYKGDVLVEFSVGGLLHDIGKMLVPDSILNKPGKLTDAEFSVMKRHPEFGLELLSTKVIHDISRKAVGQHHERLNGNGYPLGVAGSRIHEAGLICAVADVFDALTSDRVYKEAWTPQKALATIFQGCDSDFSRKYVEKFTRNMGIYPVGSFVKLNSGELAVVVRTDPGKLLSPSILILVNENGVKLESPISFDLAGQAGRQEGEEKKIVMSLSPKPYGIAVADYIGKHP